MGRRTTLRDYLRLNTAAQHEALDRMMTDYDLTTLQGYWRFLTVQYLARVGLEDWCGRHCSPRLQPPGALAHLRADLADLTSADPACTAMEADGETAPAFASAGDGLGVAYVLAGSTLGNAIIVRQIRDVDARLPVRFLADEAATAHWKLIQPELRRDLPADAEAVLTAARDTFAHFTALAREHSPCHGSMAA